MVELFVVGTFWFWALVLLEIILLFTFVEYENGVAAAFSVVAFGALLQFFGDVNIIQYLSEHPSFIASCAGAYVLLGAVWGIIKWFLFCHDKLEEYNELRDSFLTSHGIKDKTSVPPELRKDWLKRSTTCFGDDIPPKAYRHKARIIRWMSFWIVSIIWTLINDFVKKIFRAIYYRIAALLQRISNNIFGNIVNDFDDDSNN